MKDGRDLIQSIHDGAPAWFYACGWSLFYLPLAYFVYNSHLFGPYAVIGCLIFSGLYREGASIRQNNRFALELSFLAEDHAVMKQQYEVQLQELRKELNEVNESIELLASASTEDGSESDDEF